LETAPPARVFWTGARVFLIVVLAGVGILGGLYFASSRTVPPVVISPGPYGTDVNATGVAGTGQTGEPQLPGLPPLPATLVGTIPAVDVVYQQMPFTGMQGSYCWAGIATTNQSTTTSERTCHAAALPANSPGIPTVAVYPNATLSFQFADQQYPKSLSASLLQSGSMKLVSTNTSAIGGFALGSLRVGNYLLVINASYPRSYTVDYYDVMQIESPTYASGNISISIGSPVVHMGSLSIAEGTGTMTTSFPTLELWPLTLTSPSVINGVNLTSMSVINGDWVQFLPSYLPEVGPNGTSVTMLLAGAVRPFVANDIGNVSMIIQASATGGNFGQIALPLEGSGSSIVLHSLASSNQDILVGAFSVMAANQSNFGAESIIYDPQTGATNQSIPIAISIAGFFNANGTIGPQPSWLQFYIPQSSMDLSLTPYNPLYFQIDFTSTSAAPLGFYTLVVDVHIGSDNLTLFAPVDVRPPIFAG
jgi:hypothetical protein